MEARAYQKANAMLGISMYNTPLMIRRAALISAVAFALLSPIPAYADRFFDEQSGYALMFGPNVGGAFHSSSGPLIGGELSFVYFDEGLWFGFYGDLLLDLGRKYTRWSFGPEMGLGPFGIDVGYLQEINDLSPSQGFRIRGLLSAFIVSAYAGTGTLIENNQRFLFREGGLLFKIPLTRFSTNF